MAERCGRQPKPDTADAFSAALSRAGPMIYLTLAQAEQEAVRRPAQLGLSHHCGLIPSVAASASPF
jgi:hypothetical protein